MSFIKNNSGWYCTSLHVRRLNEQKGFIPWFALSNFILMIMFLTIFALLFFLVLLIFKSFLHMFVITRLNWKSAILISENLYEDFLQNIDPLLFTSLYMYVCTYIAIYTYIYTDTHTYTHIHTQTYTHWLHLSLQVRRSLHKKKVQS